MKLWGWIIVALLSMSLGCAKGLFSAETKRTPLYAEHFSADANKTYYAIRWALDREGYAVVEENLAKGNITTTWRSTTADSHYIPVFSRRDFGVNGAYYRLDFNVVPDGSRTRVEIVTIAKTMVETLQSSGIEEKKIFKRMGDFLRSSDIEVSNVGLEEGN